MKYRIGRLLLVGSLAVAPMFVLPACDTKDDDLWARVDDLFARVEKLEDICKEMNANISSLQSVMDAVQYNYSIVSVTEMEDGKGYTFQLSSGQSLAIYHGKDGADGKDGEDGADGKDGTNGSDGKDGMDGVSPELSIRDMGNGRYCWVLNGQILVDANGQPLPVN
ncbi:MAG: PL29 family lyase N-terminal domain-containing protein, partial [Bacteroidales bacterium]|nr:PL29 family lyase N-terminal domain-containing protein [Bacteroidales bacterium]